MIWKAIIPTVGCLFVMAAWLAGDLDFLRPDLEPIWHAHRWWIMTYAAGMGITLFGFWETVRRLGARIMSYRFGQKLARADQEFRRTRLGISDRGFRKP